MNILTNKTVTLTEQQLSDLLKQVFKNDFTESSDLTVNFMIESYSDYYDREIGYRFKSVTISGLEEKIFEKLQ